jgi:hypothetical protein
MSSVEPPGSGILGGFSVPGSRLAAEFGSIVLYSCFQRDMDINN